MEALSKVYTQTKFAACINKLNVTEVSCLHQQWICLPGFKWFLHLLVLEHKPTFITGSKLTNYTNFLFLTVEVEGKALCSTEEPPALFGIIWIWHREVLCEAVQEEMYIKGWGPCPNARRYHWQGPRDIKLENTNEVWGWGEEAFWFPLSWLGQPWVPWVLLVTPCVQVIALSSALSLQISPRDMVNWLL